MRLVLLLVVGHLHVFTVQEDIGRGALFSHHLDLNQLAFGFRPEDRRIDGLTWPGSVQHNDHAIVQDSTDVPEEGGLVVQHAFLEGLAEGRSQAHSLGVILGADDFHQPSAKRGLARAVWSFYDD